MIIFDLSYLVLGRAGPLAPTVYIWAGTGPLALTVYVWAGTGPLAPTVYVWAGAGPPAPLAITKGYSLRGFFFPRKMDVFCFGNVFYVFSSKSEFWGRIFHQSPILSSCHIRVSVFLFYDYWETQNVPNLREIKE